MDYCSPGTQMNDDRDWLEALLKDEELSDRDVAEEIFRRMKEGEKTD